jgi:ferredoxin
MRVTVDQDRCCGAGQCALLAPEVFDQREDDGVVDLLDERPPERLRPVVREAERVCPTAAIRVDEGA